MRDEERRILESLAVGIPLGLALWAMIIWGLVTAVRNDAPADQVAVEAEVDG